MAEGVLFNVAGKVLQVLGSPALQEIELACCVKYEVRKLEDTVGTIKALLLDAEEKHRQQNHVVIVWLQRLKDAFYDADDLLNDFATEFKKRELMTGNKMAKEVRIFFSQSNQFAYSLKMAHKIKTIRERLYEISNDRKIILDERHDERQVINMDREQTHSFVREEKIIGRDTDKNEIIQFLLDSNYGENVSVLPIIGIGGLGKTALAQLAYNDETVKGYFQLRMWVCVSDDFNVKVIVEKIIRSATDMELEKLDMDQLQRRLHKEIDGKKYLIVLDDVWNENNKKWKDLKDLLTNGARGSKILVTTRSKNVAKTTSKLQPYVLRGLPEDKSWSLFMQISFDKGIELVSARRVEIGKEIVAKCAGVPLAIKTIGNLLCHNNTEDDLLYFRNNELSKIGQDENDILPILKLSYYHLPSHLKHCFAYCALFPKDYKIEKQKLIYLWMAQGFLSSLNENQCPEDVGNKYFMNLLSMSFFQDAEYDEWGNVTICKMHDLMHDLAQQIAGTNCIMTTLNAKNIDERCRHLSFNSEFSDPLFRAKHIRTLLLMVEVDGFRLNKVFSSFKYLRMLSLSNLQIDKVSNTISKLKHLCYLDLSKNNFIKLPTSISKLRNLETLDISKCGSLRELSRDVGKMVSMRHLIMEECDNLTKMPCGLELLTNLRSLSLFVVDYTQNSAFTKLNGLNNLRGNLQIKILGHCNGNANSAHLAAKPHLQSLVLDFGNEYQEDRKDEVVLEGLKPHPNLKKISVQSFEGVKLSNWLSSLTNVTSINIVESKSCKHIPPLNELPSLKSLFLENLDSLEYISYKGSETCSSTFFPSLKEMNIRNCIELKGWWKRDDNNDVIELPSFPCLSKLEIEGSRMLTSMPLYPSLEELKLISTSSKPLQQTMISMLPSTFSYFSSPLSKLTSLFINNIEDLESLPSEGLQNLTSLRYITIQYCDNFINGDDDMKWQGLRSLCSLKFHCLSKLESLPKGLQYVTTLKHMWIGFCSEKMALPEWMCNLTSLVELCISRCHNLSSLPRGMQLQHLKISYCRDLSSLPKGMQLQHLQISICSGLNSLPEGMQLQHLEISYCHHLTSLPEGTQLQLLEINNCHNLTSLPEGLQLRHLKISYCDNLSSLPEGMQLQQLEIYHCPQLSERYRNKKGIDWSKIAHISNIRIDWKWIQKDGHYQLNEEGRSSS